MYAELMSFAPKSSNYQRAVLQGWVTIKEQSDRIAAVLAHLLAKEMSYIFRNEEENGDAFFSAAQNARIVGEAEKYYRTSLLGGTESWNVRDTAMVEMICHALEWQTRKQGKGGGK
jgi:protein-L-isoaspartate(D-aspartate) O-methyltransferase